MSIFGMFKNEGIKNMILKKFVDKAREAGINKGLLSINPAGEIDFTPLNDDDEVISKKDLDFYRDFFKEHKHLLTNKPL